jgi:hypothetical protein
MANVNVATARTVRIREPRLRRGIEGAPG